MKNCKNSDLIHRIIITQRTICASALFAFFSILFITPVFALSAFEIDLPGDGGFTYTVQSEYFVTSANYDTDGGGFDSLPLGSDYSILEIQNTFGYNFSENWQLLSGLNFAFSASNNTNTSRANSGPSDLMLGILTQFKLGPFKFSPLLKITYPFQRISETTDNSFLGEGAIEAELGLNLSIYFKKIYLRTYSGLIGRDEGRSSLLNLQAEAEWRLKRLLFGAGIDYLVAVTDDTYTDTPTTRTNVTDQANGGSRYFYAINPTVVVGSIWMRYIFSHRSSALIGFKGTIDGANSAQGFAVFAAIKWAFNTSTPQRPYSNKRIRTKQLDAFESDSQRYDESLFKEKTKKKKKKRKRRKKRE